MSKRAIEFLEAWVLEHVNPVQFREHTAEASRLTELCIEDARKVGIAQAEIEEELHQNIYDELRDRMDARTTEEMASRMKGLEERVAPRPQSGVAGSRGHVPQD